MAITANLTTLVPEEGTARFTATFTDDAGVAATPTALTWTLTDRQGNVINSRSAVTVSPSSTVTIVLSGDDLAIGSNGKQRTLLLEGIYDSSAGSDLPLKSEANFTLHNFAAVT